MRPPHRQASRARIAGPHVAHGLGAEFARFGVCEEEYPLRYQALATDYDGTIARHGRVSESTIQACESLLATGRRLVLVTGRELPELLMIPSQGIGIRD